MGGSTGKSGPGCGGRYGGSIGISVAAIVVAVFFTYVVYPISRFVHGRAADTIV
jgi:hypothetical protein